VLKSRLSRAAASAAALYLACLLSAAQSFGAWPPFLSLEDANRQLAHFFADTGPHSSGITRDGRPTYGDPFAKGASGGPLLPVYQLKLPRKGLS
jgi:hypothetical protein